MGEDVGLLDEQGTGRGQILLGDQIWMAESRDQAEKAFDTFLDTYRDKYPKAAQCLQKDREELLAFYDFPAVHWQHIRTTNPIESTFATVRLRTDKTRGCVSHQSFLAMVYKLGQRAAKRWRRLRGFDRLAEVMAGVTFKDGVPVHSEETNGSPPDSGNAHTPIVRTVFITS